MKAGYVDSAMMLYDDPRELNFTFAYDNHILSRGYRSLTDRAEEYRAVTPERLLTVAGEIFRPENLVLCIKGNKKKIDLGRIDGIVSRLG
jgi:predicted Zn-dependent peptidase